MTHNTPRTRGWVMLVLALLLLATLALRYRGIAWATLHPDEATIAGWAHWTEEHSYISDRFYAGGFFQLVKPAVALRTRMQEWDLEWQAFIGDPVAGHAPAMDMILFLRTINVWLAALTVVVFYGLALRVTGSRAGALAAAAFLAFSRLNVDHSHYAETDIAMLLTVSLALALWARVHERGGLTGFLVAAFVTGWAIGTKFTTGVLLANLVAGAAVVAAKPAGERRVGRSIGWGVLGLVICLLAIVYTNQGIMNLKWFIPQMRDGLSSVYGERTGVLNQDTSLAHAAWLANANILKDGVAGIGWGWVAFMGVGLCLSWKQAYRRFWPVMWLFPAFYGIYCLWIAPWIRGQEFMGFYPALAVWLAIGVREVAAAARRTPYPRTLAVVAGAAVIAAGFGPAVQACRSASQFGIPDPRLQAMSWLATHAPLDAVTAVENYTTPVERLFAHGEDIGQIEWTSPGNVDRFKLQYLLRNATSRGRGSVDPRTRELYPAYAANLRDFQSRAGLLCEWGLMGNSPYAFAGHRMEWWEVRRVPTDMALALPLYRPVLLDRTRSVMVPAAGCDLGSSPGLWVDRIQRRMVVSGPAPDHRTLYVILQTADRPAEVTVRLSGGRGHAVLGPYDTAVVPVRRPSWMPRFQEYDVVEIRARPEENIRDIPCYAELAFSPAEAAQRLLQKGYPDRALAFLKAESAAGPEPVWLSYVCAVQAGDWALADRMAPAARALLTQLEEARGLAPEALTVNGHTGSALAQHRRVRLPVGRFDSVTSRLVAPLQSLELERDDDCGPDCQVNWRLPVRLAAGRYRIGFTLHAPRRSPADGPWALAIGDNTARPPQRVQLAAVVRERISREVEVGVETDYELRLTSGAQGGVLAVEDVEILWGDADLFRVERLDLQRALIRHSLQRGDHAGAGVLLAAARQSVPDDFGLDRLELAWLQAGGAGATNLAPVARRILQVAPSDGAALAALAPVDETAQRLWDRLKDRQGPGFTLYPWFRLVRLAMTPDTGRRECVFEALRDNTPVLKVRAWRRKDRRNAAYFSAPLGDRVLQRGERVRIEIPPSPETGVYAGTWFTVESPPFWLSAPLTSPGLTKGRIPLP